MIYFPVRVTGNVVNRLEFVVVGVFASIFVCMFVKFVVVTKIKDSVVVCLAVALSMLVKNLFLCADSCKSTCSVHLCVRL